MRRACSKFDPNRPIRPHTFASIDLRYHPVKNQNFTSSKMAKLRVPSAITQNDERKETVARLVTISQTTFLEIIWTLSTLAENSNFHSISTLSGNYCPDYQQLRHKTIGQILWMIQVEMSHSRDNDVMNRKRKFSCVYLGSRCEILKLRLVDDKFCQLMTS